MGQHEFIDCKSSSHAGTYGWAVLGVGVLAWDILAPETLSSAVDRALERPIGRLVAIGGVAITGAHLLNLLPDKVDPFVRVFDFLETLRVSA